MNRIFGGGIGALVIGVIIFFVRMGANDAKVEEYGEDTRLEFMAELARTELYQTGENGAYLDYLSLNCHEQAWADHHSLEYVSRRRSEVVIDFDGYSREMMSSMMVMARRENAAHIAEGLGKIHAEVYGLE
ncbi:MAG: hypothetical protein R3B68_12800 [Phycisphaerales bacterium]